MLVNISVDEFNKKAMLNFNKKVLSNIEEKLNYYKMLAKYTNKTTKLNKHLSNIRIMEEVIKDYKQEYNLD